MYYGNSEDELAENMENDMESGAIWEFKGVILS